MTIIACCISLKMIKKILVVLGVVNMRQLLLIESKVNLNKQLFLFWSWLLWHFSIYCNSIFKKYPLVIFVIYWKAQNQKNFGKFKYCTSLNEKPRSEPRSLTRQSTSNSIHLATHTLRTRPRLFEAPLPKTPNPCYYSLAQSKRKCGGLNLSANCYFCCMETSKG